LLVLTASLQAQTEAGTVQFSLFYGINHHMEYGSVEDFKAGYNHFPVMPSHSPTNLGASFAYFIKPWLGFEYDMRVTGRTEVLLTDPSDGDTLTIQTPKHTSISLSILLEPLKGRISPYVMLGGGIDRISAVDEVYTTSLGYEVIMDSPSENDRLDILVQGGAGVNALVYSYFGIRADIRYTVVFADPYKVRSLNATLGLIARF
jgi:hypothetical protein